MLLIKVAVQRREWQMESKDLTVGNSRISIKLMDESYIMCEDEKRTGITVDVECRYISPRWPNPIYSLYYRRLLKAYGIGPVLVWQGRRIVGFLPVTVPGCGIPEPPLCVHYTGGLCYGAEKHTDLAMIKNAMEIPFEQLSSKEIRVGCMSVHRSMRGKNLAAQMILYMVDRAREFGWHRIKARVMLDGEPQAFYPTLSWWMGLGFKPSGQVRPFGPSKDPIDLSKASDLILNLKE
jgi:GNAT superfamily N-acetyltransferase